METQNTLSLGHPVPFLLPAGSLKKTALWTARGLKSLVVLFLAFDLSLKIFALEPARTATLELGYPPNAFFWLGWIELVALFLYLVPRTAPFGALLWTGYLGGAIATHVRLDHPLFSHTLFPLYIAVMLWLPLWFQDRRVRAFTS